MIPNPTLPGAVHDTDMVLEVGEPPATLVGAPGGDAPAVQSKKQFRHHQ